jgi:hypothetical protein
MSKEYREKRIVTREVIRRGEDGRDGVVQREAIEVEIVWPYRPIPGDSDIAGAWVICSKRYVSPYDELEALGKAECNG